MNETYVLPGHIQYAIEREREYQLDKWGDQPHEVGAWLTILRGELQEAEEAWCETPGDDAALCEILQRVAVGVACLEKHGVLARAQMAAKAMEKTG